jgi:hypothetical protein
MLRATMRALWAPLLLVACQTPPPAETPLAPRPVQELASWELRHREQPVGRLILLEIQDPQAPERWYRVENEARQWVGWVSPTGRFWRRVPFAEREQFLGVYPMAEGLARLLELEGTVAIEDAPAREPRDAAEAALRDRTEPRDRR